MITDALTQVSVAQALAGAGTYLSGNVYDFGVPGPLIGAPVQRQVGTGTALGFGIDVIAGANYTANETYTINIIESASASMSSPTVLASVSITAAQANAGVWKTGTRFFLDLPPGTPTQEFLALQFVLGGTTPTITVSAWFTERNLFSTGEPIYPQNVV
jgi:hypothetical protein